MPLVERPPFDIPEEARARDRGVMDRGAPERTADGGVARDIGEPGTADSAATRLDATWWTGTAVEILRRLPRASGAGEGSTPAQNEGLAKQLMSCCGDLAMDARLLGVVFGVPAATKAQLREAVATALAGLATPAVNALAFGQIALPPASAPGQEPAEPEEPATAATATSAVPAWVVAAAKQKKKKPGSYYPSESACIHGRRFSNDGRWRCVKNWREQMIREYVANPALAGNLKEFRERTDLQLKTWKSYYAGAAIIAARAKGEFDVEDDYYDLPNPDEFGGLPSDKVIGNVVHEYLQQKYLNDARLASHNVVSEVGRTVSYYVGGAPNARPKPQRIWDVIWDADEPIPINSLAWSLGYEGWHLRPDLVDMDDRNIFEIKPLRSAHKGVLQLWRYVSNFRMSWAFDDIDTRKPGPDQRRREWELRLRFAPQSVLQPFELYPLLKKKRLATRYPKYKKVWVQPVMISSLPGLLLYRLRKGKPDDDDPEKPDKPGKPGKIPEVIKGIIIGLLVAMAVAAAAWAVVTVLPAVAVLILGVVVVTVEFILAVVFGLVGLLPGRPQPVLPGELAQLLGDALRTDGERLGKEAVTFLGTVEGVLPARGPGRAGDLAAPRY